MTSTTISPNMNLPVPVPGQEPGPDWANDIVADMYAIDSHDHTSGKGVPITPDGLDINSDLPLNDNDLTTARTVRFYPQSAPITASSPDLGCLYESGVDLYYNDGAGNQVRITQGGNVTGSTGTITGLPSGTASASFSGGTFTFQSATNTPATMNIGPIVTGAAVASSKTWTIGASAAQASNLTMTLPVDAPIANQILIADGSGNLSWTRGVLPLGSVIATFPNLSGAYSTSSTTAADANGFVKCNGQTIVDATSPMNGAVVPNINSSVFLMGNTTAGTTGGSATSAALLAHTHAGGTYATSVGVTGGTATLTGSTTFGSSTHRHDMSHVHMWTGQDDPAKKYFVLIAADASRTNISSGDTTWSNYDLTADSGTFASRVMESLAHTSQKFYTSGVLSPPLGSGSTALTDIPNSTASVGISSTAASMTGSNSVTGNSGSAGSGSSFSILPPYITSVYLMRIK